MLLAATAPGDRTRRRQHMQVMAAWVLQHYHDILRAPPRVAYIELGPGRGTLARQMFAALAMMPGGPALLAAMHVHLVEVSHELRALQAEALECVDTLRLSQARPSDVCM